MKFSLFSAVLFSIGWMSVVVTGNGHPIDCCQPVTNTRIPVKNIVKYEIEDPSLCPRAVRFYTKRSIVICSDPDSKYAKRVMDIVDGRTATKPTICYTSTTNTIPAVTTTNKTPGKKTETSTSTTASRIVTRIKTSRPETETSTSTTASQTVTTIETSRPETVITKTTNQPTTMSKENPESSFRTAKTCGTGGPTSPSTETKRQTPGPGTVTTDNTEKTSLMRTKPSKLKIKILRKKSKTKLKKFQMNIHRKDKSG